MKAEEIRKKAQEYFNECDATRERVTLKNGEVIYRQTPYTIAGLCAHLNIEKERLEKAGKDKLSSTDKAYAWARCRVEQHIVERALLGELNHNMAALVLKSWGYGMEETKGSGELHVVLEDPDGYAR